MKKIILVLLLCWMHGMVVGQEKDSDDKVNDRIYFIVGIGTSYIPTKLYNMPAVDKTTNNVIIENGQKIKTNLSLGIVYTPYFSTFNSKDKTPIRVTHGLSYAAFFNPVNISKATNTQTFMDVMDVGFGIGWKSASNFLILGTIEFFGARQPRDWFIEKYKNNNNSFLINDSPQLSFDINDNDIFQTKVFTSVGIKFCYTFDVIKNFNYKE